MKGNVEVEASPVKCNSTCISEIRHDLRNELGLPSIFKQSSNQSPKIPEAFPNVDDKGISEQSTAKCSFIQTTISLVVEG